MENTDMDDVILNLSKGDKEFERKKSCNDTWIVSDEDLVTWVFGMDGTLLYMDQ